MWFVHNLDGERKFQNEYLNSVILSGASRKPSIFRQPDTSYKYMHGKIPALQD